jgi:alpha-D-ribose 1-methylphosphonate 5-triphosphate synthase subunit PhnL
MTTCFIKYIIDPSKIADFEHYGKLWIDLVNEMGGLHHGYLLPHRRNNIGYASFFLSVVGRLRNLSEQNSEHTKMS